MPAKTENYKATVLREATRGNGVVFLKADVDGLGHRDLVAFARAADAAERLANARIGESLGLIAKREWNARSNAERLVVEIVTDADHNDNSSIAQPSTVWHDTIARPLNPPSRFESADAVLKAGYKFITCGKEELICFDDGSTMSHTITRNADGSIAVAADCPAMF